jgi:hypothetical protein
MTISEDSRPPAAGNGWSMFTLAKYQVGSLVVRLSTTSYTVFLGGCVTAQLQGDQRRRRPVRRRGRFIIDFTTRQALQQALEQRSGGRLHLDPCRASRASIHTAAEQYLSSVVAPTG